MEKMTKTNIRLDSGLEEKMYNALIDAGYIYDEDFINSYTGGNRYGYIMDFAFPNKRIDIECDGEPFHKIGNNHDRRRDSYFKEKGWTVLRFRGKEISKNIDYCIRVIKTFVNKKEIGEI